MTQNVKPILESLRPITPAGADINVSIAFYETLGFSVRYRDESGQAVIVARDGAEMWLQQSTDTHWASQTAYHIRTKNVPAFYEECQAANPKAIHPNGQLAQKPWGTTEFSILDPAGVCITFYEFPTSPQSNV